MPEETQTIEPAAATPNDPVAVPSTPAPVGDLMDPNAVAKAPAKDIPLSEIYLPDDIRNDPSIKDMKDVTSLAKRMIASEKLVGADKVVIPGKDATAEQWSEVYNKLGRPASADSYNLEHVPDMPEGIIDDDKVSGYGGIAHELGLTTKQANGVFQWYQETIMSELTGMDEVQQRTAAETTQVLQEEFGNAFPEKIRLANSVFRNTRGGEEALQALKDKGLANDASIIKWAVEIGASMGEDRLLGLDGARAAKGPATPVAAQARIAELRNHKAYNNQYDPEHTTVMKEVEQLLPDAFPPKA